MKSKLPLIARLLLGLIFFVFGLNGFLNFIPVPPNMPERLTTFMGGLMASGYFFPFLKGTEVICGLLLLIGAFVPLALVVLAPIVLNIFLVHAFMAPSGLPLAVVNGLLLSYLAFFADPYSGIVKQIFRCPMKETMDKTSPKS
jgi:putative oxidoreductase